MKTADRPPQGDVRLRAGPDVAITIDPPGPPPEVLLVRGRVMVTGVEGIVPECALAQRRHYGEERAAASVAEVDVPGMRMARIPSWAGVIDFETRSPGGSAEDFQRRGR